MSSVLITGANRGIGLGLVQQFLNVSSIEHVFATARNVSEAKDLQSISDPKLHIISLEVTCENSIKAAVAEVEKIVGDKGLDILINNAGIINRSNFDDKLEKKTIMQQFEVNSVAPVLIATNFRELLKKAAKAKGTSQVVNVSSAAGSLDNAMTIQFTGISIYSMSKAALNMMTRKLAQEWKEDNIRVTSFCPGWVQTEMGGAEAITTVEFSTTSLTYLILSLSEEHNGNFYDHQGDPIAW